MTKDNALTPRADGGRDIGSFDRRWATIKCLKLEADVIEGAIETESLTVPDGGIAQNKIALPNLRIATIQVSHEDFEAENVEGEVDYAVVIPKGAFVLRTLIDNVEKFDDDENASAAVIKIGDGTVDDRYNTGTPNVFVDADVLDAGAVSGDAFHDDDASVHVTLTMTGCNVVDLIQGKATINIFYLLAVDHG